MLNSFFGPKLYSLENPRHLLQCVLDCQLSPQAQSVSHKEPECDSLSHTRTKETIYMDIYKFLQVLKCFPIWRKERQIYILKRKYVDKKEYLRWRLNYYFIKTMSV